MGITVKTISLTQGKIAVVDDVDHERVAAFNWHAVKARNTFYAARSSHHPDGRRTVVLMHRFILGLAKGEEADHVDHDGLNNCRANLRPCAKKQNLRNRRKPTMKSTSRYKGVCWDIANGRWRAGIGVNRRRINLGSFTSEAAAAEAYDAAAREHHGDFAAFNFPQRRTT